MKQKTGRKLLSFLLTLAMVVGLVPGMSLTAYAAEKSETISLIGEKDSENQTATGTHFKVTLGGFCYINDNGAQINSFGPMTVSSLDETVMTKVVWSYKSLSQNSNTLSASPGTYNGSNTITGINSAKLTVSSSSAAGVKLNSIAIYYDEAHTHTWATAWSHDATYHWHACTGEGASDACLNETGAAKATHTYGDTGDARFTCTVCEYVDTTKRAEVELADAKTVAKADLDTLLAGKTEADYDADDWTTLTQAIADGKTAIDNATTIDDVTTAKSNAETAANAVKTTAEKKEEADTAAANGVSDTINNLPAANEVTTANKNAIEAARAAYNALTDDQKAKVSAETLKKLTDAEDRLVVLQVMSEVSAKTGSGMTYTGSPIQLINTPTTALPTGYIMKYAVTTENTAPSDNLYTTYIPAKTEAGTYYVWYKVVGDANHNDSEPQKVTSTIAKKDEPAPAEVPPVSVTAHVQRKGTLAAVSGGAIAGTTGKSLRMESLRLTVPGASETGGIEYRGHVQRKGWEKAFVCDGGLSGTEGKSRRLEAVQIQLWGDMESKYDVYYRVHVQRYGWMAWAKNGDEAGTQGMSRRVEAVQVVLVEKDAPAPAADFQGATQAYAKAFAKK